MKTTIIILLIAFVVAAGCSSGGDVNFTPDPDVAALFNENGSEQPFDKPPDAIEEQPQEENNEEVSDCFAEGFCHKDCKEVADCPAGFSCVMNVCTFDCQTDVECGKGGVCNSMGLCEAVAGEAMSVCRLDEECGEGRFCNSNGACEKIPVILGCQTDVDCPYGQFCDEVHECVLFTGTDSACNGDFECPFNYYCGEDLRCKQDCHVDIQCGEGKACEDNGKCVSVGEPSKITSFNFDALGSDSDPTGSVVFSSQNFRIDSAVITIALRGATLTSPRFRLTGSIEY